MEIIGKNKIWTNSSSVYQEVSSLCADENVRF